MERTGNRQQARALSAMRHLGCLTRRAARAYMPRREPAGWQSGYAEDCKSSYSGSIPLPASRAKHPEEDSFSS